MFCAIFCKQLYLLKPFLIITAVAVVEDLPPPAIDLSDHDIKPDMFDGIHVLEDNFEKIDGAPNFRQLKGFPIFGTGQPTEAAMVEIINKAKEGAGREGVKVVIFVLNFPLRQELKKCRCSFVW